MTTHIGPAALERPGPDTEGITSMYEPTYLTPQHILDAVEHGARRVHRDRLQLQDSARDFHLAVVQAVVAGATEEELIAHGVERCFARHVIAESHIEAAA